MVCEVTTIIEVFWNVIENFIILVSQANDNYFR